MIKNDPIYYIEYARSQNPCEPAGPFIYNDIDEAYNAAEYYSAKYYEPVNIYENNAHFAVVKNYG
jgi:hypothetical protein